MKWLGCCLLLATTLAIHAQDAVSEVKKQAFGNPYNPANENFINMMNEMSSHDRMSLLLFDHWAPMEIVGKDSSRVRVDSANYHIQSDKIIFFNEGQFYQLFPERIDYVTIGDRHFISANYVRKKELVRAYFEVLEAGDLILLLRHEIERKVTNDNPLGLPAAREIEMKQSGELYYLTTFGRLPEPVPRKKRDLIALFRRDRKVMANFANQHKLSMKKINDVRTLFAYYNALGYEDQD